MTRTRPHPDPDAGLPVSERAEETRRRLLEAALAAFSRHGYDGVTTRALAEAAGVNLAAIPYHFGGKQGVYLAVARLITDSVGADLRQAVEAVRRRLEGESLGRDELIELLSGLLRAMAQRMLGSPQAHLWAGFLIREQLQPTAAFDILYEGYMRSVHETLTEIVARVIGRPGSDPEAVLRAHALLGGLLLFRLAPEVLKRRLGWDGYTPQRVELIAELITRQLRETLQAAAREDA